MSAASRNQVESCSFYPDGAPLSTAGCRSPLRVTGGGCQAVGGNRYQAIFPLGVPNGRGCRTAHRLVRETVPRAQRGEGLQMPPPPCPSPKQVLKVTRGICGQPQPSKLGKGRPPPGVPRRDSGWMQGSVLRLTLGWGPSRNVGPSWMCMTRVGWQSGPVLEHRGHLAAYFL